MHGGRKHKSTDEPIHTQCILFDISRQNKSALLSINLDAGSCYDRMVPNYGTLSFSRLGLPQECSIAIAKTQKHMSHKIGTTHGTSINHCEKLCNYGTQFLVLKSEYALKYEG